MDNFKTRMVREVDEFLIYFAYLALFLCSFATYKGLILEDFALGWYVHYSYSLFEAFILAKLIVLGQSLKLGERFADKPLIVPTLYQTIIFSFFVLGFSIAEHFMLGLLHGKSFQEIYEHMLSKGIYAILAGLLVMFFVFILMFAFIQIGRVWGEGKLLQLFFRKRP